MIKCWCKTGATLKVTEMLPAHVASPSDGLRNSIVEKGLINPLYIYHDNTSGVNWIVDGVKRYHAILSMMVDDVSIAPQELPVVQVEAASLDEVKEVIGETDYIKIHVPLEHQSDFAPILKTLNEMGVII